MATHMWVEMKYTPVTAVAEEDGSVSVYTTQESDDVAHAEAKLGCWFCYTPLTAETINEDCPWPSTSDSTAGAADTTLGT